MIRLFRRDETNFNHNEWVLSQATVCKVTEVKNGSFEIDLEHPTMDKKELSKYLTTGNIIKCAVGDSRGEQLFRIRKVSGDKTKTVFAQSKLIADLSENRLQAFTITGKTRKEAIQLVLNAALDPHEYVAGNKDTNTNTNFIVEIQEGSVLDALVGSENSILSVYGGEFIIDNNTIDIVDKRGTDRGYDIRYGKNIKGINATEDDTDLATVIIPKVSELRLPEYVVESPNLNAYEKRYFKELDISGLDVWDGEGEKGAEQITQAEAFIKMREAANLLFTKDHIDLINFSYELDLAILSKTEEYKSKKYYLMEDVFLGDTVKVYHEIHNIDLFGEISKTVYNVLLGRYDSVTVGFKKQGITDIINDTIRTLKFTKEEILLKVANVSSDLYTQIQLTEDTLRLEATNTKEELQASITITAEGIRQEVTNADAGLQAQINVQAGQISQKVSRGSDFSTEILQNETAVVQTIHGATDNKMTLDSNGLTVTGGGFLFESETGEDVLKAYTNGAIRLGNADWSRLKSRDYVLLGGYPLDFYLKMSEIDIDGDVDFSSGSTIGYDLDNVGYFSAYEGEFFDDLYVDDTLYTESLEVVGGSKNCTQQTENFGLRKINAYETAEYYFGDLGSGIIQNGECIVLIDPIFQECINSDIEYHVFLQAYSGTITSVKRYANYFIVNGTENTEFSWELKAKRKGFENNRLELSNYNK